MTEFELKQEGSTARLELQGDLTAASVPEIKSTLLRLLEAGVMEVEFDFEKTVAIDSTGIGLLIAAYNSLSKKGGIVRVVRASEDIYRLLQSMRLEKRLSVSTR